MPESVRPGNPSASLRATVRPIAPSPAIAMRLEDILVLLPVMPVRRARAPPRPAWCGGGAARRPAIGSQDSDFEDTSLTIAVVVLDGANLGALFSAVPRSRNALWYARRTNGRSLS